jgi:hypothetical protein
MVSKRVLRRDLNNISNTVQNNSLLLLISNSLTLFLHLSPYLLCSLYLDCSFGIVTLAAAGIC